MTQDELDASVGYVLKRAQAALRGAMDAALREHGLTTPQYVCLELLDQRPGLSNAELARGAFVSRQSMNVVLRGLEEGGLVERPAQAAHGRALPVRLTAEGRERLRRAHADVFEIERRMVGVLGPERVEPLLADLTRMAEGLGG
ncbi:MarR family transcriptional regulator [Actinoallomurus sp. NPDC052274]|uniref:MarR family winged helix-turn-helix transcriptional regulator n=1 Tax=Actinoallomurus sp. NPDC052274 TaxID=3155420 RepID=UPI00343CF7E3